MSAAVAATRRAITILVLVLGAGAAALLAGPLLSGRASAAGPGSGRGLGSATLLIRHQYAHCHAWSLNGGPFRAHQSVTLNRGATLTVIDDDVMPHRLVELAGAGVIMRNGTTMPMMGGFVSRTPGMMSHMGAWTTVAFSTTGVYRFRTRAGEDYLPGIETGGADNVLTLTITVR